MNIHLFFATEVVIQINHGSKDATKEYKCQMMLVINCLIYISIAIDYSAKNVLLMEIE